ADLFELFGGDALDLLLGEAEGLDAAVVEDADGHSAIGNCAEGEFGLRGGGELADEEDIEIAAEAAGDGSADFDTAAGEAEDDAIGAAVLVEGAGEELAGFGAVAEAEEGAGEWRRRCGRRLGGWAPAGGFAAAGLVQV